MPVSDEKYTDYLVQKFRDLGKRTTNWAFVFFLALLYTWLTSIYPRAVFLHNFTTIINKQAYFDSLSNTTKKSRRQILNNYIDSLANKSAYLSKKENINNDQAINRFKKVDAFVSKASISQKEKDQLKKLVMAAEKSRGDEKKLLKDSIKRYYLPIDVLIVKSEIGKTEADYQKDSLQSKMDINFEVPGLSKLDFEFRSGLLFYMTLTILMLIYVYSTRRKLISLVGEIYHFKKVELKENISEGRRFDLQAPFWMGPIDFKKQEDAKMIKHLLGWRSPMLNNFIVFIFLLAILILQFYVGWMSWHLSVIKYFQNTGLTVTTIFLLSATVFMVLLWLWPVRIKSLEAPKENYSIKRRELLKLALSSSFFLFLLPPLARSIPLIQGDPLNYKRKKKQKGTSNTKLENGFYLYSSNRGKTIHYFQNGITPARKTFNKDTLNAFATKSRKLTLEELLTIAKPSQAGFPHYFFILEYEALQQYHQGHELNAIRLLVLALSYYTLKLPGHIFERPGTSAGSIMPDLFSISALPGYKKGPERICTLLSGMAIRTEMKSPGITAELAGVIANPLNVNFPISLEKAFIADYRNNKSFAGKWVTSKSFPWKLPNKLPWS